MSTSTLLNSLFRHKAWANEELYAEVAKLDPATQQAERHSAIRLLNHIFVVDRIFRAHLAGEAHGYAGANTPETPTLDELRAAVAATDRWYVDYTSGVPADRLAEAIDFTFTDGLHGRMTREEMLAHVITHGSYHRGGVGRILAQAGVQPPRDIYTVFLHRAEPQRREPA
ncbi:MAG: DinB family protein [Burkholderiales bacterium]|nr:DinB family protein [Burkholderiales bacterium]